MTIKDYPIETSQNDITQRFKKVDLLDKIKERQEYDKYDPSIKENKWDDTIKMIENGYKSVSSF